MSFWEDLKLAMVGARNPLLANQIEKGQAKELELDNNPAGKNIIIPYNAMQPRKEGLQDGNIVDDYLKEYYDVGFGNPTHGTNEVYNPISGLSSGSYTTIKSDSKGNPYIYTRRFSRRYDHNPATAYSGFYHSLVNDDKLYELDNKQGVTVNQPTPEQLQKVTPVAESNTKQEQQATSRRDLYNQNQGGGISTQEAYRRQKLLREKGFNVAYDGYYGDASRKAWAEYQASLTPKMETPSLAVAPSVNTELKYTTPPEPYNVQGNKNINVSYPANIDMSKTPEERQKQHNVNAAATNLALTAMPLWMNKNSRTARRYYDIAQLALNYDGTINDYSSTLKGRDKRIYNKLVEKNPDENWIAQYDEFVPQHQNASGEELEKKQPLTNTYTSGYFIDENGNPIVSEWASVNGYYNGKNYNMQREIINKNGLADTLITNNNKYVVSNPDSLSKYNKIFEELIKLSKYIPSEKQGGSLKKCSCGCKTLLKRGKGGRVIESRNCK